MNEWFGMNECNDVWIGRLHACISEYNTFVCT